VYYVVDDKFVNSVRSQGRLRNFFTLFIPDAEAFSKSAIFADCRFWGGASPLMNARAHSSVVRAGDS